VKVRRLPAWAPALAILALSALAITLVVAKDAVVEAGTPRLTTSATRDVTVRQGRSAVFRYRVRGAAAGASDVGLRVGSAAEDVIMTVHLGRQPVEIGLSQHLRIDLAPGLYLWSIVATDSLGEMRSSSSVAFLTVR
jgi:hypothetical protein